MNFPLIHPEYYPLPPPTPPRSKWLIDPLPNCAAGFALLNLPKGKSLGRSKPATSSYAQALQHTVWDDSYYIQALDSLPWDPDTLQAYPSRRLCPHQGVRGLPVIQRVEGREVSVDLQMD